MEPSSHESVRSASRLHCKERVFSVLLAVHAQDTSQPEKLFSLRENLDYQGPDYALGNMLLLVALPGLGPGLSSRLLLNTT